MENRVLKMLAKLSQRVVRNLLFSFALLIGVHLLTSAATGAITFKAQNSFSANTGAQPFGQLLRATNGLFYGTTASGGGNGLGTIYSATTAGALNLVASFDGTNGAQPLAGLIQGGDGRFYGTASAGGEFGQGTIFVASADGSLTNLYSFDGTNGSRPLGPLTLGVDGNFYGTASAGSVSNLGTIFMLSPAGDFTLLYTFTGPNGAQPSGGLVQVGGTNFYGTATSGGAFGYGTVFTFTQFGFANLYFFTGGLDGAGPQSGLTLAADGLLYGTAAAGGTNFPGQGHGTVFAIDSVGNFARRHSFNGTDGASPLGTLVQGAPGVIYGTTAAGGPRNAGTIFMATVGGGFSNIYSFNGGADGAGPSAGLTGGTNGNFFGVAPGGGKNHSGTLFQLSGFSPFIIQAPVSPVTAVSGDTVVLTVIAGGSAPLTYQWQFNSNNVVNGKNIAGATTPTLTLNNITPAQAGTYFVIVRNSAFQIAIASATVSVIPRPIISITTPQRGARIQSSALTITGTTSGDVAAARVYYQLDDGGWKLATSSDNWAHWRANVTMPHGIHQVDAFAESVLGTYSKTNSVAFECMVTSAPVVVEINGHGTVNPNLDGQFLQLGKSYSMTAVPAVGSVFADWTGSTTTSVARVMFVMQSNRVLEANFKPDLFFTGKGNYNGLFQAPPLVVSPTNSGMIALTLTSRGAFTGFVQLGVKRTAISGHFDIDGKAQVTALRRNLNPLTINLELFSTESASAIHGIVTDGVWNAGLNAYRTAFNAKSNPALLAGRYTLVIPGQPGAANVPGGDSYGVLSVNSGGLIQFSGSLSDDTKITQSIAISQDGNWELYVPLYAGQGLITGRLIFTSVNSPTGTILGNLTWFKPEVPTATYYPAGFLISSDAVGASYVKPPNGTPILDLGTNGVVTFSGGDLAEDITNSIALDNQNRVTNFGTNAMSLSLSVTNGVFHGNVTDPGLLQQFPFRGVVLQNENSAAGYFLGPMQSGEVLVERPIPAAINGTPHP
jgi:uncharacterized repeat protein (TIGR03803 family)